MAKEELDERYKDVPFIIEGSIKMTEANEPIKIYEGNFILKSDKIEITVNGKVTFYWTVSIGSRFSGEIAFNEEIYNAIDKFNDFVVVIDGLPFGNGFITKTNFGNDNKPAHIQGKIGSYATLGDKSIAVEKIIFSVPNFIDLYGSTVRKTTLKVVNTFQNRVQLENDDYTIVLDKCQNYKEQKQSLEERGGYIIQYYGELRSKKGSILLDDAREIFHCLMTFLSFLNGRRTAPFFYREFLKMKPYGLILQAIQLIHTKVFNLGCLGIRLEALIKFGKDLVRFGKI